MWPSAAGEVHGSLLEEDPAWMAVTGSAVYNQRRCCSSVALLRCGEGEMMALLLVRLAARQGKGQPRRGRPRLALAAVDAVEERIRGAGCCGCAVTYWGATMVAWVLCECAKEGGEGPAWTGGGLGGHGCCACCCTWRKEAGKGAVVAMACWAKGERGKGGAADC